MAIAEERAWARARNIANAFILYACNMQERSHAPLYLTNLPIAWCTNHGKSHSSRPLYPLSGCVLPYLMEIWEALLVWWHVYPVFLFLVIPRGHCSTNTAAAVSTRRVNTASRDVSSSQRAAEPRSLPEIGLALAKNTARPILIDRLETPWNRF